MKRLLTKKQEQVIRLVHHDFEGLTQKEAAMRMNITQQTLQEHLRKVKDKCPQLFPILTKLQAQCYHYLTCDGLSLKEIAKHMGIAYNSVHKALQACARKGLTIPKGHGKILRYHPGMDDEVVEKF